MKNLKNKKLIIAVMVMMFLGIVWSRFGADITLHLYKQKVKNFVDTQEYSMKTKAILYVAIDHIRYPEDILDYKRIYITRADGLEGKGRLIGADGFDQEVMVDEDDWYVVIGDTTLHRYYNAIIDKDTLEYLGTVPIA